MNHTGAQIFRLPTAAAAPVLNPPARTCGRYPGNVRAIGAGRGLRNLRLLRERNEARKASAVAPNALVHLPDQALMGALQTLARAAGKLPPVARGDVVPLITLMLKDPDFFSSDEIPVIVRKLMPAVARV